MSDLIRRDDVVKAMNEALAVGDISRAIANDILNNIPSAEPEQVIKIAQRSGKTLESAINYLQSTGWLQEHDRNLTESVKPERKKGTMEKEVVFQLANVLIVDIMKMQIGLCYKG